MPKYCGHPVFTRPVHKLYALIKETLVMAIRQAISIMAKFYGKNININA
jgi:hypothetical protein